MSNNKLCKNDTPKIIEINEVVKEGKDIKSFFFEHSLDSKPGQFIMVWLPGVDEKPMAVSYHSKNEFGFTFQVIGKFTNVLNNLKKGDKLGIRGPYGNCFSIRNNACVVGGGMGMAPLSALIDKLKNPVIINGAKSKDQILYLKRFKNKNMSIATDDGSCGKKCFTTNILEEQLKNKNNKIKIVYTCGPEIMMKKILGICNKHNVECEASLERMMKSAWPGCPMAGRASTRMS